MLFIVHELKSLKVSSRVGTIPQDRQVRDSQVDKGFQEGRIKIKTVGVIKKLIEIDIIFESILFRFLQLLLDVFCECSFLLYIEEYDL